jgi:uncharacterized protein with gpF-like domain
MKITTAMGNAAMKKAVDNGLVKNGVTLNQRNLLDEVIQAAIDADATLQAMIEVDIRGPHATWRP